jgi:hypothetical protein
MSSRGDGPGDGLNVSFQHQGGFVMKVTDESFQRTQRTRARSGLPRIESPASPLSLTGRDSGELRDSGFVTGSARAGRTASPGTTAAVVRVSTLDSVRSTRRSLNDEVHRARAHTRARTRGTTWTRERPGS